MLMKLEKNWSQTVTETPDTATLVHHLPCHLAHCLAQSPVEVDCVLEHIQLYVELMYKH